MQSRSQRLLDNDSIELSDNSINQSNDNQSPKRSLTRKFAIGLGISLAVIGLLLLIILIVDATRKLGETDEKHINHRSIEEIHQCLRHHSPVNPPVIASPRQSDGITPLIVLQNGTVHDGLGEVFYGYDIAMQGGVILNIGVGLSTVGAIVHQLNGSHVTPGLVDLHSHIGVFSWPEDIWANADDNEMSSPITPQMRALDAFDPEDQAIEWTLRGGVTTSHILPAALNIMGGDTFVIKHKFTRIVRDMLVPDAPRGLKMACGENPKRVYGSKGMMPTSRMGIAWLMRETLERARRSMEEQFEWCSTDEHFRPFPHATHVDSLIALMRHEARLHQHCFKTIDIQTILRLADEFGYFVGAFHHATDAWKIPELLTNITVATWADWNSFKAEAAGASFYEPAILEHFGVPVVIHSDDVVVARYLAWEAAKAHSYGLSVNGSIKSITSVPASALGLQNRVGSLRTGLDADVVIWNAHPLTLGARPSHVFIEGKLVVGEHHHRQHNASSLLQQELSPRAELECPLNSPQQTLSCYAVVGVSIYSLTNTDTQPIPSGTVLVRDGVISCVGTACQVPAECVTIELAGGVVAPGFIESGSHLGQMAIDSEEATLDGTSTGADSFGFSVVQASDGIHMAGRKMDDARHGGILTSISAPLVDKQLVVGFSTVFHTATLTNGTKPLFITDTNIQQRVSVHISMGNVAKQAGVTNSFSGQVAYIRGILYQAKAAVAAETIVAETDPLWAFVQVVNGLLPLSIEVHGADEITALIRLRNQFQNLRMIIQGGAEAHLVADKIAAVQNPPISVLLTSRQPPSTFETSRSFDGALRILMAAGVQVGLQIADADDARNLRWEAGWQRVFAGDSLSTADTLKLITTNIVNMFKITSSIDSGTPARGTTSAWATGLGQVQLNTLANFVLYNGDPLDVQSHVQLIALGQDIECRPRHHMPPPTM